MGEGHPGRCTCGRVRYHLRGEPIAFYACHCTDCQRESGSAFGLSMIVRSEDLEHVAGELRRVALTLPDGRETCTVRCAECFTRLWSEPVKFPQVRTLRPGTLDDPHAFEPYGNMWTRSAQPWAAFAPGPRFEQQPEDVVEMVRVWQGRPRAGRT